MLPSRSRLNKRKSTRLPTPYSHLVVECSSSCLWKPPGFIHLSFDFWYRVWRELSANTSCTLVNSLLTTPPPTNTPSTHTRPAHPTRKSQQKISNFMAVYILHVTKHEIYLHPPPIFENNSTTFNTKEYRILFFYHLTYYLFC